MIWWQRQNKSWVNHETFRCLLNLFSADRLHEKPFLAFLTIPDGSIISFYPSLCLICLIKNVNYTDTIWKSYYQHFLIVKAFLKIKLFVFSLKSSARTFTAKVHLEKVHIDQFFLWCFTFATASHNKFSFDFIIWLHCWQTFLPCLDLFELLQSSRKFSN